MRVNGRARQPFELASERVETRIDLIEPFAGASGFTQLLAHAGGLSRLFPGARLFFPRMRLLAGASLLMSPGLVTKAGLFAGPSFLLARASLLASPSFLRARESLFSSLGLLADASLLTNASLLASSKVFPRTCLLTGTRFFLADARFLFRPRLLAQTCFLPGEDFLSYPSLLAKTKLLGSGASLVLAGTQVFLASARRLFAPAKIFAGARGLTLLIGAHAPDFAFRIVADARSGPIVMEVLFPARPFGGRSRARSAVEPVALPANWRVAVFGSIAAVPSVGPPVSVPFAVAKTRLRTLLGGKTESGR